MSELDRIYIWLLRVGFIVLRQAVDSGDSEWVHAELEMLHNIPHLLGEERPGPHQYYWEQERPHYIAWATSHGNDWIQSRMMTYYEPIWDELQKLHAGPRTVGSVAPLNPTS